MKAVVAVVYDDRVALRWREGWDKTGWLPDAGDIKTGWDYHNAIDENLELRIRVMDYGFSSNPILRDSIRDSTGNPDSPRTMPLTNERFISALVNHVRSLLTEWDWILTEVARVTGDDSLHQFTSIGHALDAKWRAEDAQKAKASKFAKKRAKTRTKHIPTTEELKAVFMGRMDFYNGYPDRGDPDRESFWSAFQQIYEDIWPYNMKVHDELPIRVIKDHCKITAWRKEWDDLNGLIKK